MALPKTYRATARLGWRSTTGDPDGELTETGVLSRPSCELPTGRVAPAAADDSAVRVGGERLYKKAQRGEVVETPRARGDGAPRRAALARGRRAREFEIECSSGTYVRSLIETLGDAYCESLRRTAIGPLRVEDARSEPARRSRSCPSGPGAARPSGRARPASQRGAASRPAAPVRSCWPWRRNETRSPEVRAR